jgi:hypothetical protein
MQLLPSENTNRPDHLELTGCKLLKCQLQPALWTEGTQYCSQARHLQWMAQETKESVWGGNPLVVSTPCYLTRGQHPSLQSKNWYNDWTPKEEVQKFYWADWTSYCCCTCFFFLYHHCFLITMLIAFTFPPFLVLQFIILHPNYSVFPFSSTLSPCICLYHISFPNLSPCYPSLLHTHYPLTVLLCQPHTPPALCNHWQKHSPLQQQKYTQTHTRTTKPSSPHSSSPTHPCLSTLISSATFTKYPSFYL